MRVAAAAVLMFILAGCGLTRIGGHPETYVVFFPGNAVALTHDGAVMVNSAAADANRHPAKMVEVSGPLTKAAGPNYDPKLAAARVSAVEHALAAAGVDERRLVQGSLVTGAANTGPAGDRRVEIRLIEKPAPPSG